MATQAYNPSKDLREAAAMGDAFKDYVLEKPLYGTIGAGGFGSTLPRLTIGAFMLRLRRLHHFSAQLTAAQQATLQRTDEQFQAVARDWGVQFEGKLLYEANSRLDAMREFFRECLESPQLCASAYRAEAQRRTIIQEALRLIEDHGLDDDALLTKVKDRDGQLRSFVETADFLWTAELEPVYPPDEFWWLYAAPPESDN